MVDIATPGAERQRGRCDRDHTPIPAAPRQRPGGGAGSGAANPKGIEAGAKADLSSVGCLMWQDGETEVMMALVADFRARTAAPDFDGVIDTPSGTVMVSTVEHDVILTHAVATPRTRVRIWLNRPQEPDEVLIGLG